jgi:potassium efflux system protein
VKKWKKCFISKSMSSVYLYITIFSILLSGYAVALAQTNSSNKTYTGNTIQERVLENEGNPGKGFERTQSAQESLNVENKENETSKSLEEKASYTWVVVSQVWHYEITKIEGNPITVGNIIIALLLLVMGFLLSKRLATQVKKQLIERFKLDEASAVISQQIMYYLLLVLLVLFVLNFAGIPLTFFAVLGGAAAIGVGFGSQTIVNNFLSGLILMMERHIKIGDIVEVENILGIVEWVGTRSTIIKTFDNVRLVLPNGTLLQSQVVNWSLADDIVRREILVGVRYGSSVREVENLLKQAVNEHNLVEEHPQPVVLFEDFGENALVFSVLIWVRMYRTGKSNLYIRQVESDIRFRIDELFRQNDIVIAFPQRDIHIDTLKPLEVKVTQE